MSRNSAPARKRCSSPATLSCLPARLCSRSDFIPVIAPVPCHPSRRRLPPHPSLPPSRLPAEGLVASLPDAGAVALSLLCPAADAEQQPV